MWPSILTSYASGLLFWSEKVKVMKIKQMNLKETKSKNEIHCILPVLILWIFASSINQN